MASSVQIPMGVPLSLYSQPGGTPKMFVIPNASSLLTKKQNSPYSQFSSISPLQSKLDQIVKELGAAGVETSVQPQSYLFVKGSNGFYFSTAETMEPELRLIVPIGHMAVGEEIAKYVNENILSIGGARKRKSKHSKRSKRTKRRHTRKH